MDPVNFCFWLQGWREILEAASQSPQEVTEKQIQVIKSHLKLVFEYLKGKSLPLNECVLFCYWMLTEIEANEKTNEKLNMDEVFEKLHSVFKHVIDPSYEGDQQAFQNAHSPGNNGGSELITC